MGFPMFSRIFGTAFVGTFLSALLFGIISVQAHLYFQKFRRDPLVNRIVVSLLWTMQLLQVAISSRGLYHYVITSQLDPYALAEQIWQFSYYGTHTVLTSAIVQIFFLYRLWIISPYRVAILLNLPLVVGSLCCGTIVAVRSYIYRIATDTHANETWNVNAWLALSAAADTGIALSLVFVLRRQRTGYVSTDTVLNWIILYGITTGAITSIVAIALLICYAGADLFESLLLIGIPLGGVYISALLVNLHTRTNLRARIEEGKEQKADLHDSSSSPARSGGSASVDAPPIMIARPISRNAMTQTELLPSMMPRAKPSFPSRWPFIATDSASSGHQTKNAEDKGAQNTLAEQMSLANATTTIPTSATIVTAASPGTAKPKSIIAATKPVGPEVTAVTTTPTWSHISAESIILIEREQRRDMDGSLVAVPYQTVYSHNHAERMHSPPVTTDSSSQMDVSMPHTVVDPIWGQPSFPSTYTGPGTTLGEMKRPPRPLPPQPTQSSIWRPDTP